MVPPQKQGFNELFWSAEMFAASEQVQTALAPLRRAFSGLLEPPPHVRALLHILAKDGVPHRPAAPEVVVLKLMRRPEPDYLFRLKGDYWHIRFGGVVAHVKDSKGMQNVVALLRQPHRAVPALELMRQCGSGEQNYRSARPAEEHSLAGESTGAGGRDAVLDFDARNAYQRKMTELVEEIEEAKANNDLASTEKLQIEFDILAKEFNRASFGGRPVLLGPPPEAKRARVAVCKSLDRAYKHLASLPELLAHLKDGIRTEGTSYAYRPGSFSPAWTF